MKPLALFLLTIPLAAETRIDGPTLGIIHDAAAGAVRTILGTLGAARLSDPVAGFEQAAAGGAQDFVLGVRNGRVSVLNLRTGVSAEIEGILQAGRIAVSASGAAAAVVTATRLYVLKGLPEASAVAYAADLPGKITALAVADDRTAWLAVNETSGAAVYRIRENSSDRIASGAVVRSLDAFGDGAAFLDGDNVFVLRGDDLKLAGVVEQASVVALTDEVVYVAAGVGVHSIRLADGAAGKMDCSCTPALMRRLNAPMTFQLTDGSDGPVWVYEGGLEPRIAFIPQAGGARE